MDRTRGRGRIRVEWTTEVSQMLANEPMTDATTQPQAGSVADGPVIAAPGAPGGIIQPSLQPAPDLTTTRPEAPGVEGELTIWEGHYSARNFIGRILMALLFTGLWGYIFYHHWQSTRNGPANAWTFWSIIVGILVLLYWANLIYRYLRAYRAHHYRLTNRRLFVTTGVFTRRVDQLELIRIDDIYIQQSMVGEWLGLGNVVVISSEKTLPKVYLLGIDDPRTVMDSIWHYMRLEQEGHTARINPV